MFADPVLAVLAQAFAGSVAGRGGGVRDFIIDYEKLLDLADSRDGERRVAAADALARAEQASFGKLRVVRHRRTGIAETVRLTADAGGDWLFAALGKLPPSQAREALATWCEDAATRGVPATHAARWQAYFHQLATHARSGDSMAPFRRDDPAGNAALLAAARGVLGWQGESMVRYASAVICGDSKQLESLGPRLAAVLEAITGSSQLDAFGIVPKPRTVTFHGPLTLRPPSGPALRFGSLPGPVTLSETNLQAATAIETAATTLLTVENEEVFLELTKANPGVLMVLTSFPGAGVRRLLAMLPSTLTCLHFGDADPAGFDILRDLREKSGRHFTPLGMTPRAGSNSPPFTAAEIRTLQRLIATPAMADLTETLTRYLAAGHKGRFEQETVPLAPVLASLQDPAQPAPPADCA